MKPAKEMEIQRWNKGDLPLVFVSLILHYVYFTNKYLGGKGEDYSLRFGSDRAGTQHWHHTLTAPLVRTQIFNRNEKLAPNKTYC